MSDIIWTILVSLGGICVGSFLNTLVFRTNKHIPLKNQSACLSCARPLHWLDRLPIVSFFALRARCRHCSAALSWQYPVIEMATGILFGLLFVRAITGYGFFGFEDQSEWLVVFMRDALIACYLLIIFVYDFRFSIILDRFSIPPIIIAILFNVYLGADPVWMLLAGLFFGAFFGFQFLISNGQWVGSGDIRIGLLIGFLFSFKLGFVALLFSYVLGALVGIFLLIWKHRSPQSHVPFGTFAALAMILTLFVGEIVANWYIGLL